MVCVKISIIVNACDVPLDIVSSKVVDDMVADFKIVWNVSSNVVDSMSVVCACFIIGVTVVGVSVSGATDGGSTVVISSVVVSGMVVITSVVMSEMVVISCVVVSGMVVISRVVGSTVVDGYSTVAKSEKKSKLT